MVFKGVPFAAPPVGDLRWKTPQPVKSWEGVRKASEFGPNPMQENIFGDMNFGTSEMSKDCLYLNIWSPSKTLNEGLPVLIYFNGGGLMAGSGSEPRYAGLSMARKGIISITANYREGISGFYANSVLSKETAHKDSGNYGILDQVAAITWVKNNIKAFGGDPSRITIVGDSAGSMSVSVLMASPLCKGLFAQAMGSSGSVLGYQRVATLKEAEKAGDEKMKAMGCKNLKELRALPAGELLKRAGVRSIPQYNIDGFFLTEQPMATYPMAREGRCNMRRYYAKEGQSFAEVEMDYQYDMASFLEYYSKTFSLAGLSRITGINPGRLSHYITGHRSPSARTKEKMQKAIHVFAKDLETVHFV